MYFRDKFIEINELQKHILITDQKYDPARPTFLFSSHLKELCILRENIFPWFCYCYTKPQNGSLQ